MSDRFTLIETTPPDEEEILFLIWDRVERQVIDVMTRDEAEAYQLNRL